MERDKGKKGKINKKRKKGKKGQKKGKKKKDKDLTPDRTTESLFEEMVMNGIIKQYPKVKSEQREKFVFFFNGGHTQNKKDFFQVLTEYHAVKFGLTQSLDSHIIYKCL